MGNHENCVNDGDKFCRHAHECTPNNPDMQPTVTEALKPCPFCGGEAKWIEDTGAFDEPFGLVTEHSQTCHFAARLAEKDQIIASWNTRHRSQETARSADVGMLQLVAGYADYKAISDDRYEQGKAAGYRELGEIVAAALTTPPADDGGLREALRKRTFLTCVSGDGPAPYLKVHFNNLADAHAAHDALLSDQREQTK